MRDAEQDPRLVGRDEMNLAEFPIALLADRVPEGCKTLVFGGKHGKLTVSGSDAYGLPTAPDADVIVALLHLTKTRNDFTDPTVIFTRYEVLKLLGWPDQTRYYRRLDESLNRWVGVTLYYDGCWWDNEVKCWVDAKFHIIDRVVIYDRDVRHELRARQQPLPFSSFTWGKDFFDSCQANNLKRLDLGVYFGLKSAGSKQLYRHLDKRFYLRPEWTYDLRELAFEHVGLSRTYGDAGRLKAKLQPAIEELEAIGFLEPMTAADRYSKAGRGAWNIRLVRKLPAPAETKPEPEMTGLEKDLIDRGVSRGVAADLARDFAEDRIRRQLEAADWLHATKPKRIKDLGAYLVGAIREDYAAPAGFKSQAERAERETAARAEQELEEQARQAKVSAREAEARIAGYWKGLTPDEQKRLEAEALAGAAPADRAAYEAASSPARRLLLVGLRDALIRRRLGLPAVD